MVTKVVREIIAVLFLLTIAGLLVFLFIHRADAQSVKQNAQINFTAPTTYVDGTPIPPGTALSYNVFQGLKDATKTMVSTITNTSTTISTGLQAGKEYCWAVTVLIAGRPESDRSNEACKLIPLSQPTVVTITVT